MGLCGNFADNVSWRENRWFQPGKKHKNIPDKIHGELWSNHALKTSPTKQMACEDYGNTSNLFRFLSVSMTNFCIFKIPRCSKSRHRWLEEYKPLIDMDTRHDQSFTQRLYSKLKGIMPKCIVNEQRINNMLIFQFKL